jgi:fructose/tagatose bisphosphate aldolase
MGLAKSTALRLDHRRSVGFALRCIGGSRSTTSQERWASQARMTPLRWDSSPSQSFLAATKVDALAVAVGTSHAMLTQDATLDFKLIGGLGARVEIPLVLHGSSGVSDP